MMRALLCCLLLCGASLHAQVDSVVVLSETEFLQLVATHHPLAVRADLQRDRARAVLQQARGGFDPKVYGNIDQKYFKGTRYYSVLEGGVKVPTWYGIELNAAYERNEGTYLNPERTVPSDGLYAAGLSVSLGRGLLFDERRAELRRARLFAASSEAERLVQFNDLLYTAAQGYWEWAGAQGAVLVYEEALTASLVRYEATLGGARLGDRPAIDTLEARIQVQSRRLALESARLDLDNAVARLNAFLWLDGVVPVELTEGAQPPLSSVDVAPIVAGSGVGENPELLRTRLKLQALDIDERIQREQLKPQLDLKYNALLSGGLDAPLEGVSSNNYKWGVTFAQPILLRKERGKLALTRIKQSETQLELSDKTAMLAMKVAQAENEVNATASQYAIAVQNVGDYARLLEGERELLRSGESSLFLINSRELKYIEAQLKQVELLVKHRKARQARTYALGQMVSQPSVGDGLPTN